MAKTSPPDKATTCKFKLTLYIAHIHSILTQCYSYVFPGIGLGAILSKSVSVTQGMIYASGAALSDSLLPSETAENWLYPDINRIRDVSVVVTKHVIRAAQKDGVDRELQLRGVRDEELEVYVRQRMYDPFTEHEKVEEEVRGLAGLVGRGETNGVAGKGVEVPVGVANGGHVVGKER